MVDPIPEAEPYLPTRLARREQSHRRGVLLGMGALIVLGTSPVFGHHLASKAEVLLAGRDHVFNLCLVALHALFAPVHGVFHILLLTGLAYATVGRVRALVRSRSTLRALGDTEAQDCGEAFALGASAARVDPRSICVVRGLPTPAFTIGVVRPRIYLAGRLPQVLTLEELTAVIAHEGAHATRRDPLRLSVLRFLGDTLFYIPALRRLAEDMADDAEIAADDIAAAGSRIKAVALASAIVKLAAWPGANAGSGSTLPAGAVGFGRANIFERRVRRLLGEDATVGTHVTRRSLSGAFAALALVWISGLIMAHPVGAQAGGVDAELSAGRHRPIHCQHRGGSALGHIFCLGFSHHVDGAHCPHTGM
jgi:beta-lactamase regulating signal transducer with metallopeptidase domain